MVSLVITHKIHGIVINKDGSWRYNDNEIYEYDKTNLKSWKYLA